MSLTIREAKTLDRAGEIMAKYMKRDQGEFMSDPSKVKQMLRYRLQHEEREVFCVMYLNNQHQLIEFEKLFFGTIDGASVHPREVVKNALMHNASALVFAHNHPSGVETASKADKRITDALVAALKLVDIRVLDHLIVGNEIESFAERGYL